MIIFHYLHIYLYLRVNIKRFRVKLNETEEVKTAIDEATADRITWLPVEASYFVMQLVIYSLYDLFISHNLITFIESSQEF